jgi:hypothetical protein
MRERSNSSFTTISFLSILFLLGLVLSSPVVKAQDSMYEVKQDYEYYGVDLRSEHSYYPDKESHIRGLDNIKISQNGNSLIIIVSDSLFSEKSFPFLNVSVENGENSDMPIFGELLNESGEMKLDISTLMGDKEFARIVIWVENTGENDAKRVLEIRRKTI